MRFKSRTNTSDQKRKKQMKRVFFKRMNIQSVASSSSGSTSARTWPGRTTLTPETRDSRDLLKWCCARFAKLKWPNVTTAAQLLCTNISKENITGLSAAFSSIQRDSSRSIWTMTVSFVGLWVGSRCLGVVVASLSVVFQTRTPWSRC